MKDTMKFVITLFLVTLISAFVLSFLYSKVQDKIEAQKKAAENDAINFVLDDPAEIEKFEEDGLKYWKGTDDKGVFSGYAVLCEAPGFSSTIKIIAGCTEDGRIIKIKIIDQAETPGLGANMEVVQTNKYIWDFITGKKREAVSPIPFFQEQFFGKSYGELRVVKEPPKEGSGEIETLTGATISSQAAVDAIKAGIGKLLEREGSK